MKYSAEYFKQGLPDWKRKKDPLFAKLFYRPLSFYLSSFCANHSITANHVSAFSVLVGIIACLCFYFHGKLWHVIGALLISTWLLLDCVDGNLARSTGHQPFGDFIDALSSYTLVAFLGVSLGYCVYCEGGLIVQANNPLCIVFGAIASTSDTLMRLAHQKYRSNQLDLEAKNIIPVESRPSNDHSDVSSLRVKIEMELGIAGILPIAILIAACFNALDLIVYYMLFYYSGSAIVMITMYVKKAMRYNKIKID